MLSLANMTKKCFSLYREDCIAAQYSQIEGEVIISPGLNLTIFSCASIVLLLAVFLFLFKGEYTRKARLEGIVIPSSGLIKVVAHNGGYVTELLVQEGEQVKAGQILYRLSGEHYDGRGMGTLTAMMLSLTQQYQLLERQRDQEKAANAIQQLGIRHRNEKIGDELRSAQAQLKLAQQQAKLLHAMIERYRKLFKEKYIAEAEYRQKEIELSIAEENVEQQRQVMLSLEGEIAAMKAELESLNQQGKSRQEEIERQLQDILQQKVELEAQKVMALTAPVDGSVAAVLAEPGQTINLSDTLMTLIPASAQLQVELYAPSKSVGFIKPRQRVGLRFDSFPYEKFGIQYGAIREVTRSSLSSADLMLRNSVSLTQNEGHYRVIVDLEKDTITAYGKQEPLRAGMTVAADVELDNRYLYEWLLEPVWSLRGKI